MYGIVYEREDIVKTVAKLGEVILESVSKDNGHKIEDELYKDLQDLLDLGGDRDIVVPKSLSPIINNYIETTKTIMLPSYEDIKTHLEFVFSYRGSICGTYAIRWCDKEEFYEYINGSKLSSIQQVNFIRLVSCPIKDLIKYKTFKRSDIIPQEDLDDLKDKAKYYVLGVYDNILPVLKPYFEYLN